VSLTRAGGVLLNYTGLKASSWAPHGSAIRFLGDLPPRWDGQRVLVIGHVATRWGLDHFIGGVPLEDLIEQDFAWQQGWEYQVS
jgi:hypothetical protein